MLGIVILSSLKIVRKTIYIVVLLVLTCSAAIADDIRFTVQVSATRISMQDFVHVQYLIENSRKVSQFIPPDFKSFDVVEGPDQTAGWNMENGELKEYVAFSFLLKPAREGRLIIPFATARIDGKLYRSNSLSVDVGASMIPGLSENQDFASELVMRKGETVADKLRNNIFVKLDVDKKTCYEGEPVVATYKLYTRLRSESKVTKRPSFNGFSVYDMINPESEEPIRESFQGREYNVYLLRKVQLYPLQSGNIELDPVEVENTLTFIKAEHLQSGIALPRIMKNLAEGTEDEAVVREKVLLSSAPVAVDVKPLPEERDPDFNGAVGNFEVRTFLSNPVVHKNDLVNLVVKISGKGNFPMLAAPAVNWPATAEPYETTVQEYFSKFTSPISGAKVFNIPFTVQKEGDFVIPAVDLHYFDPISHKYAIARSDSLKLHVEPAVRISPSAEIDAAREPQPGEAWKWIISLVALAIVAGSIYILLRRTYQKPAVQKPATVIPATEPSENATEADPMNSIREAFEKGDPKEFYSQLGLIMGDCMRKKYKVDFSGNWEKELLAKGVDPDMISDIRSLKEDATLAMYTPFVMESKMVDDLARIEKLIC
ncbi:MAG TPA: BatD family protein [Chitinophagaceae bacterium]|nr:BatD family protein [Chitinophagaceae bacterium]